MTHELLPPADSSFRTREERGEGYSDEGERDGGDRGVERASTSVRLGPNGLTADSHAGSDRDEDGLPQKFGKYTLLRKLASGGMAELFLAIQKSVAGFEKLIVIKRILPAMNRDQAFIQMLLQEARIAATLSHPNIVQIFDVGQVDGTYFIAMEHVHGEDLRQVVRQMKRKGINEFPIEHSLAIVLGMCSGLAYAHEKRDLDGSALNIVHRDISPQNIVLTFTGDIKIVDFGIAKSDAKMNGDTKSGKLKGKIPYMSPEQARGGRLDGRSDIFAAGVILFELTTGKRLFKGQSEFETLKLICERKYPLPSQVVPGYPPELEQIVMRALAKNREDRFQNAREMQACLEDFARREQIPVSAIALTEFMQSLFQDKLVIQKEALLQGKQLADIIDQREAQDSLHDDSNAPGVLSTPAAARTVTEFPAHQSRGRKLMKGAVAVAGVAAAVLGTFAWIDSKAPSSAVVHKSASAQQDEGQGGERAPIPAKTNSASDPASVGVGTSDVLANSAVKAEGRKVDLEGKSNGASRPRAPAVNAATTPPSSATGASLPGPVPSTLSSPVTPGKGLANGKLNVGAAGGWCEVSVDGSAKGPTPIAGLELTSGPHKVSCAPPEGRPGQVVTVSIVPDATTRFRFDLKN